jgi:hypothetical protein
MDKVMRTNGILRASKNEVAAADECVSDESIIRFSTLDPHSATYVLEMCMQQ